MICSFFCLFVLNKDNWLRFWKLCLDSGNFVSSKKETSREDDACFQSASINTYYFLMDRLCGEFPWLFREKENIIFQEIKMPGFFFFFFFFSADQGAGAKSVERFLCLLFDFAGRPLGSG